MRASPRRSTRSRYSPKAGPPDVWFVGDWGDDEFLYVRRIIDVLPRVAAFATFDDAAEAAVDGLPPEVLLLAQPRQGCIEQAALDAFLAAAPLTRVVVVAGSWCEGERRTGRPLVGALRIYWHEIPAWWRRNLAIRVAGLTPDWSRAADSGLSPPVLAPMTSPTNTTVETVAIDSIDIATFETIADALQKFGFTSLWTPRGRGVIADASAAIWDGGQLDDAECDALAALRARLDAKAPIIALLDYPRFEHLEQARALGAAVVLGKPYSVVSLFLKLTRALQPPALPGGSARAD